MPRPPFWQWLATAGKGLNDLAVQEVERLGLPVLSTFPSANPIGFVGYWRACLLSDYDLDHMSQVQDWPRNFGGEPTLERVYPPSRQTLSVGVSVDGPDRRAVLTIKGPVALVTRETLLDAVDRALALVPASSFPRHPVLSRRKRGAAAIVRARPDERHKMAAALHADGASYARIADALADAHPEAEAWNVTGSTVGRWLRKPIIS